MSETALLFPGIGADWGDAERELLRRHADAIVDLLGPEHRPTPEEIPEPQDGRSLVSVGEQTLTFGFSVVASRELRSEGLVPRAMAGHSLGVYAVAVEAGCIGAGEGLRLVLEAHRLASRAARGKAMGMLAVAVMPIARLRGFCDGEVRLAVRNGPTSAVLAGPVASLACIADELEGEGARIAWLDRDVPYHHPALEAASSGLARMAVSLEWRDPAWPVYSTLDGVADRRLTTGWQVRDYLTRNLSSPIDWEATILALAADGAARCFECGPGATLTRLARFIDGAPRHDNHRRGQRRHR